MKHCKNSLLMRNRKILFILLIPLVAQGKVIEESGYTLVHSQTGDTIEYTYDAATKDKPLNSLIIAANGGTNNITIKGKLADGSADASPTIDNKSIERNINTNGYSYTLHETYRPGYHRGGAVMLADQSYEGKNNVTFENVTIAAHDAPAGIMSYDKINSKKSKSLAPATLTFKGRNTINMDADPNANPRIDGILLLNNDKKVGEYRIISEEGSTLNINIKSGKENGQGITVNHYGDTKSDPAFPSITTMEFKGDVNIKIDRNGQEEAESNGFGLYSGSYDGKIPDGSKIEAIFRGNVDIVATPVYDEQGRPKSIGSAFAISGRNNKVEIVGGEDKVVKIKGDIFAYNGGSVSVNLANKDSYFEGEAHIGKKSFAKGKDMFGATVDADGYKLTPDTESIEKKKKELDSRRKQLPNKKKFLDDVNKKLDGLNKELDKFNQELAEIGENDNQNNKRKELEKKVKSLEYSIRNRKRQIENLKEDIERVAVLEEEIKRSEDFFDENGLIKDSIIDDKTKNTVNLKMSNGARWRVTNDSMLKELDLSEDAQVEFSNSNKFVKVSVSKLKGDGGVFKMYGDIVKGESDKLITRKGSEGTHIIEYEDKDKATAKTTGKEYLKLVENRGDEKDNKAIYKLNVRCTEQGAYCFSIGKSTDSKIVEIKADNKHDFYLHPATLSSWAQAAVVLNDLIYQSNLTLTESLHQRLGEVHFNKEIVKQQNVWVKSLGGEYVGTETVKVRGYTNRYRGLKAGYDWIKARGNWINYNGLSFGYINSTARLNTFGGKIHIYGKELGLYSAWLNKENDLYLDFWAKAIRYRGGYNVINYSNKDITSPNIIASTYIFSSEMGKRFNLSQNAERVIYFQPEAQLSYHATNGYSFKTSHDASVKTERMRSLVGRIGFRAGLDYFNEKNLHPYIKLMYEREFLGEMQHTFNEVAVERFSNRGSWWVYGFGLSYMNKAKNTQLYFEAQRSSTHNFKQNWQAHLGVRYLF
ncbi:autotransporter outer membrane beta-barrel domain-containing protein [Haemophilus haemolyticus]|uniref:autotransporter outer membrane beta-barrel domain-containing protein n=1 Tax=Haemophilus haemolyticus TaxID=726 RepID=UPI00195A0DBB|nr:autotransporter outer membrane beta-barrel domain-containing protein [Haemophilus haemolyticus]